MLLGFSCSTLSTKHVCPLLLPCSGPLPWTLMVSEGVCDGFPACVSPSNTLALFFTGSQYSSLESFCWKASIWAQLDSVAHTTPPRHTRSVCFIPRQSPEVLNDAACVHVTFRCVCMSTFSLRQCLLLHSIWTHQKRVPLATSYHLPRLSHTHLRAAGWRMRRTMSCHLARAVHWHWRVVWVCMWQTGGWEGELLGRNHSILAHGGLM